MSAAVMVGGQQAYFQATKLHAVTRLDFAQLQTASDDRVEQPARAYWGDENRGGWDASEQGQMGAVGVQVGDQDDVRLRSLRGRNRTAHPTEMTKASGQDRVKKNRGTAILPSAGAVPPPGAMLSSG